MNVLKLVRVDVDVPADVPADVVVVVVSVNRYERAKNSFVHTCFSFFYCSFRYYGDGAIVESSLVFDPTRIVGIVGSLSPFSSTNGPGCNFTVGGSGGGGGGSGRTWVVV